MANTENTLVSLDETVGKLESMGTILVHLATSESEYPELTSLADLGRIITSLAKEALVIVSELEFNSRESTGPKASGDQ